MRLYFPNLFATSKATYKENFREYKKERFPKKRVTKLKLNNYEMLTQPEEAWTDEQVLEAKKVVKYLITQKPKIVKNQLTMRYRKPLFWGR